MSFGGFLGIGYSYHLLPWKALNACTRGREATWSTSEGRANLHGGRNGNLG